MLSIKPVVALEEGLVVMVGKARGSKNANNLLTECVHERGPIDYSRPYCLAYSGLDDTLLKKYLKDNAALYEINEQSIPIHRIGSTIGTHVGPGAIAASFFVE